MGVSVEIKSKGIRKKTPSINDIILENQSYGVSDHANRLIEGEIGKYTIIFNTDKICRGYDVLTSKGKLEMNLPVPTSAHDIKSFYETVRKACKFMGTNEFIQDGEKYNISKIDELIPKIIDFNNNQIKDLKSQKGNITLFGVKNPIAISDDMLKKISISEEKFSSFMDNLQQKDIYYSAPRIYKKNNSFFGVYTITNDSAIFPDNPAILDKSIKVDNWYVDLGVIDKFSGTVKFEDFIKCVDKTNRYDAEHFIINLNEKELKDIIDKYKTDEV